MAKQIKNIDASVRAWLLNLSKANGQSFDLVLTRFALERLLFRLSQSPDVSPGPFESWFCGSVILTINAYSRVLNSWYRVRTCVVSSAQGHYKKHRGRILVRGRLIHHC